MNVEELKNCFDCVTPTKEQKDKMLQAVMNAKKQPVKVVKFNKYKYFSVAAAVVAIGVFAVAYSYINGVDEDLYVPEVAVEDTGAENKTEKKSDFSVLTDENISSPDEKYLFEGSADVEEEKTTENKTDLTSALEEKYPELSDTKENNNTKTALNNDDESEQSENVQQSSAPAEEVDVYASLPETDNETSETVNTPLAFPEAAKEPAEAFEDAECDSSDDSVSVARTSGGGGSAGGGGGGGSAVYSQAISLGYIQSHAVYSALFPSYFADGFKFASAEKSAYDVTAEFISADGRYMMVNIEKKSGNNNLYGVNVITPEQLKAISLDGYAEFALDCGDYYVIYYVETNNSDEIYKMVKSSAYFK